ncbi:hypothetical protein ACFYYB_16460 [Streptomyces sp. NPDC002886]
MGSVMFVDETTAGGRRDGWGMEVAEEKLVLRELISRLDPQQGDAARR